MPRGAWLREYRDIQTCLSANLTHEQRETIAPAARTAMPDLQLGIWIDAKRRERAYEATG
jgi:hypothetical protein